jgi:O-antigen/teichoic acid export membrane protein
MTDGPGSGRDRHARAAELRAHARRGVPYSAVSGLLQIAFSLVGMLLLVRYLAPDTYGVWVILVGLAAPLLLVFSMGQLHALLRFMPALDDAEDRRELLWRVAIRRVVLIAVGLAVLFVAYPMFAERFGIEGQRTIMAILLPGFVALAANEYLVAALNVAFRQREIFFATASQQIVFVGGVALGIVFERDLGYFAVMFSLAAVIQSGIAFLVCVRHFGGPKLAHLRGPAVEAAGQRRYRLTSYVDDVGTMLLSSPVNRLLLAGLANTGEVAIFAVASNIVDRLLALQPIQVFRPIATVSLFARFEQSGDISDLNRMFRFIFGVDRSVSMLFLVLFAPLGEPILTFVFRPEYAASYAPAVVLIATTALFTMPAGMIAQTLKRPQALVWSKLAILINLGLGIPLTLRYGALGMASAAAISSLVRNAIVYLVLRLEFDLRFPWSTLGRYVAAGVTSMLVIEGLERVLPLLAAGAIGLVVYAISLRIFAVLDVSDRALLVSLLPTRVQGAAHLLLR